MNDTTRDDWVPRDQLVQQDQRRAYDEMRERCPVAHDDPESIKLPRGMDADLIWGRGIHLCLGAPLAKLEIRAALDELLKRTRRFEVARDAPRRTSYPSNGLVGLQLRFG